MRKNITSELEVVQIWMFCERVLIFFIIIHDDLDCQTLFLDIVGAQFGFGRVKTAQKNLTRHSYQVLAW
ncbi:hypothetical protein J21TS3_21940 [Paenibacillus cookii]|uniref:Uncharacterized protein n=1 Tax=Paenibacillus cookii TaxID=157839 RepID=A0ABQ4LW43_9BACL|nr:hypothetical protein J21TS3_21940 [Paenibacillus cookii]